MKRGKGKPSRRVSEVSQPHIGKRSRRFKKSRRESSQPGVSTTDQTTGLILNESIVLIDSSKRERNAMIVVKMPVVEEPNLWMCFVSLEGVFKREVVGATPLNALVLALQHLGMMLFVFVSRGGGFRHADFALPADLFFGRLWCGPEDLLELVKKSREKTPSNKRRSRR